MMARVVLIVCVAFALSVRAAAAQSVDFTVLTGVLAGDIRGAQNTKVDDYVYWVDPLNRGVTALGAAIAIPSTAGKLALVVAGNVTPAGGLSIGGSWQLGRGFGAAAGMTWLLVNESKDGKAIGAVPDNLSDPFDTGVARAWFVGATYSFRR